MGLRRRLLLIVPMLLASLWLGTGHAAAAEQLTITVVPAQISPPLQGEIQAIVVATNNSASVITVDLVLQTNGLIAEQALPQDVQIPAQGTVSFPLPIARASGNLPPGAAVVQASYQVADQPTIYRTAVAVPIAATVGAFTISQAAITAADQAVRVDDVHQSQFSVELANTSAEQVTVTALTWDGPGYLEVGLTDTVEVPFVLPPNSSSSVGFSTIGTGALASGSAQIRISAALSWPGGTGSISTAQPVDVGAFGESQIGDLLTIPTLLVLPGAVLLAIWSVLWSLGVRPVAKSSTAPFPVSSGIQFGVVCLLLSALAIAGYWLTTGQSLLAGYGSLNILVLVVVFVGIALLLYLGVCLVRRQQRHAAEDKLEQQRLAEALTPGMTPDQVLDKLAARKADVWVPQAIQQIGSTTRLVLVPNHGRPADPVLVCVPIELALEPLTANPSAAAQLTEQHLCAALSRGGSAAEVIQQLASGTVTAQKKWRGAKDLAGIETAAAADLTMLDRRPLVFLA